MGDDYPDNSLFPREWKGALRERIQQVVDGPQRIEPGDYPGAVNLIGLVEGRTVLVSLHEVAPAQCQAWAVWTSHLTEKPLVE